MKQGWEIKKLGEVCESDLGKTLNQSKDKGELRPYLCAINVLWDKFDFTTLKETRFEDSELERYSVKKGDLLICEGGDIGRAAIWNYDEVIQYQNALHRVRLDKSVLSRFLLLYLKHLKDSGVLDTRYGKGVTIKHLVKSSLLSIPIPAPPIEEQEKIVEELDCLSGIIEKKREQLKELDALAESIFYTMFGDPITNEKGFPVYQIDDIITFQGGSQPDKSHFEYEPTDDNIRLIQIRDYKSDKNITYIPKSLARRLCNAEDIMIGRYGPPIFQILKGIEGAYNVALMKAIPKQGNREFIRAFLKQKCLLEYLESMSKRTAGQDGIQMDKLKAYPFPLPPIELQDEFADKIEAIEKQKELIKQSITETEELFNSRMDYYFN